MDCIRNDQKSPPSLQLQALSLAIHLLIHNEKKTRLPFITFLKTATETVLKVLTETAFCFIHAQDRATFLVLDMCILQTNYSWFLVSLGLKTLQQGRVLYNGITMLQAI